MENRDLGWSRPASGENWVPMNELYSRIVLADQYVARNAERNAPEQRASMRTRHVGRVGLLTNLLAIITFNI